MGKKTTLKLDEKTALRLLRKKEIGESYDDVIRRLLDKDDKS